MILKFDQKIFNNNYAKPFRVIQYVLSIGFVLFILSVIVGMLNLNLTIPDGINTAIAIYLVISIVGFPFVVLLKKGQEKLIKNSTLTLLEDGTIEYNRLTEQLWTILGLTKERKIYHIRSVDSVKKGITHYSISGCIDFSREYNEKQVQTGSVAKINIPIAFEGIERIETYAK